jgi:hypothetical protein
MTDPSPDAAALVAWALAEAQGDVPRAMTILAALAIEARRGMSTGFLRIAAVPASSSTP